VVACRTVRFAKTVSDAGLGQSRGGVHSRVVTKSTRALAALQLNGWGGVYTAKRISPTVARGLVCGQRSLLTPGRRRRPRAFTAKALVP
jgi:hypothetical protein